PARLDQEAEAEFAQRRQRAADERHDDAAEQDQDPDRGGPREAVKNRVAEPQPIEGPGARIGGGCLDIALQSDVDHRLPPGRLHPGPPRTAFGEPIKRPLCRRTSPHPPFLRFLCRTTVRGEGPALLAPLRRGEGTSAPSRTAACPTRP